MVKQFKRDKKQNSTKLHLDKYYTSNELALYCIQITNKILVNKYISEWIEPSAGNGSFSKQIQNCVAYDLEPEDDSIIKADFLTLPLEYKFGRGFIGNPPFGARNTLAVQFFKRCILLGDYISFILPISQFNNNQQMYEFDLLHTQDLGVQKYSNKNIHCCLNIYCRPKIGLNKKPKYDLSGITIIESRLGKNRPSVYDFAICAWGSLGKQVKQNKHFSKEFYFVIDSKLKDKVISILQSANWTEEYIMTSTPNLLQWQVYKYLQKYLDK